MGRLRNRLSQEQRSREQACWECRRLLSERRVSSFSVSEEGHFHFLMRSWWLLSESECRSGLKRWSLKLRCSRNWEIHVYLDIEVTHNDSVDRKEVGVERKVDVCIEREALSRRWADGNNRGQEDKGPYPSLPWVGVHCCRFHHGCPLHAPFSGSLLGCWHKSENL